MKPKTSPKLVLFGFFLLLILMVAVISFAVYIWGIFITLTDTVQAAIGAAVLTVLGSVASLIYSNYQTRKREIEQALYEKKQPVYEDLLRFLFSLMEKGKANQEIDQQEVTTFIANFSQKLMLWGSDDVIKAYVSWRRTTASNPTPSVMLLALEDLFRAIRLDFGHRNKGLAKGDLLSFIITDTEQILSKDANSMPTQSSSVGKITHG